MVHRHRKTTSEDLVIKKIAKLMKDLWFFCVPYRVFSIHKSVFVIKFENMHACIQLELYSYLLK